MDDWETRMVVDIAWIVYGAKFELGKSDLMTAAFVVASGMTWSLMWKRREGWRPGVGIRQLWVGSESTGLGLSHWPRTWMNSGAKVERSGRWEGSWRKQCGSHAFRAVVGWVALKAVHLPGMDPKWWLCRGGWMWGL